MLTHFSLSALLDIALSRLGPHLKELHIGTEDFRQHRTGAEWGAGVVGFSELRDVDITFANLKSEHEIFRLSGMQLRLLTTILASLPNLETMVIRHSNSMKRSRDGWGHEWRSYGVTTLRDITNGSYDIHSEYLQSGLRGITTEAFILVTQALSQVPNSSVKGIEILSKGWAGLTDAAFSIPSYIQPSMMPVLQKLEKLHLDMLGLEHQCLTLTPVMPDTACKFIVACSNLLDLRLNGSGISSLMSTEKLLQTLAATPEELPKLEALSLGKTRISKQTIVSLLKRFQSSLIALELWRILLTKRPPQDGDANNDNDEEKLNESEWSDFLDEVLLLEFNWLHHITLGFSSEAEWSPNSNPPACQILYRRRPITSYTGPDWRHYIEETIPEIRVVGRQGPTFNSQALHHTAFDDGPSEEEGGDMESDSDSDED